MEWIYTSTCIDSSVVNETWNAHQRRDWKRRRKWTLPHFRDGACDAKGQGGKREAAWTMHRHRSRRKCNTPKFHSIIKCLFYKVFVSSGVIVEHACALRFLETWQLCKLIVRFVRLNVVQTRSRAQQSFKITMTVFNRIHSTGQWYRTRQTSGADCC